jgi:TonB family protein
MDATLLSDLLAYSAQVGCIVAVGSLLPLLLHIDAAGVRYAYWRALLVLCLALPWLQPRHRVTRAIEAVTTAAPPSANVSFAVGNTTVPVAAVDWVQIVAWILLAGIVLRLSRVGLGLWRLRRLRVAGHLAPPCEEHEELQSLVRARAEIRYVAEGQPVTFGVRHPVVLLPAILQSQPPDLRRVVLCHELFHVRRRDWVWVVAEEIVRAALWFHPGVWWLISRVRLAREEVVDELTVLATGQRRTYIEALLLFADAAPLSTAPAFARRRDLFRRMMLISKEAVMSSTRVVLSSAAMAVVVIAGGWFAVTMFPLTQVVYAQGRSGVPAPVTGGEPGPLERRAKPITPENPIPRRIFSVMPVYPAEAGSSGPPTTVNARVTLDEQGRVGEVRWNGFGFMTAGSQGVTLTGRPGLRVQAGGDNVADVFFKASADAIRQWQYDPPASGPIAFDVVLNFRPDAETQLVSHGDSRPVFRFAPPPPPPAPLPTGAVRVGGNVTLPRKVKDVSPVYPPIAQSARVQGVVIAELVIGPDGRVQDARVLRSIPLLDQAALDAVKQWEFAPTLLNGKAVPVVMTAAVQFSLP